MKHRLQVFLLLLLVLVVPSCSVEASFFEGVGHVKYYGFYDSSYGDQSIPRFVGSVNVSITGQFTENNATQYVDWKAEGGIHSIYQVANIFFNANDLTSDYQAKWNTLASKISPSVANGSIVAFYLYDEPYGNLKARGVSRDSAYVQLQTAARVIKASFPNTPIMVVEGRTDINPMSSDSSVPGKTILFPPEIDWIGFDCYGGTFESCGTEGYGVKYYFDLLKSAMTSNQRIVLVPQIAAVTDPNNPTNPTSLDQDYIINLNQKYVELAESNSEVIAVLGYTSANIAYNGHNYWWGGLAEKWGNLDNRVVVDSLLANGRRLLFKTSCRITLPFSAPTGYANGATTFVDNYLNASADKTQCMKRANDLYNFFGVPSIFTGKKVTSSYIENGVVIETNIVGSEEPVAPIVINVPPTTIPPVVMPQVPVVPPTIANPITSPNKPVSVSFFNFGTTTLRNGSRGEAVKELQRYLNYILNLGLVVDGKLGPKTIAVIKVWQRENGLVPDGFVGNKTKLQMLKFISAKQ